MADNAMSLKVGDRVRARIRVLEEGPNSSYDPNAKSCTPGWLHAEPGELGTVVHADPPQVWPTVRFDRTGTATCVIDEEVERVEDAKDN